MVEIWTNSPSRFNRFINITKGTNVLAMQVPANCDLTYFRKLWKQPKAEHGDWIIRSVNMGHGGLGPYHILMKDERFKKLYRRPY